MIRRLLLVRHGITAWNREGRFQGHLDPPLAEDGREEARLLAARLVADGPRPDRILSSPLERAAGTARVLAGALRLSLDLDARLMEIGQGEWEGRTHEELAETDAERYAAWRARAGEAQPPGAETIEQALDRVRSALDELLAAEPSETVCLVTHGGIARLAARHLLGLEPRRAWAMDVDNASLSVLARVEDGPSWRVETWNDTAHLLGRRPQHVDESEGEPLAL
ncbi:MAG TPA: histidine phosphatase family protein [candidate division Zixibacteria bacterium]|nr:histidine phosphatase family protein [candidate division Zixibacteria bacterium]